jgi:hypothetical protein
MCHEGVHDHWQPAPIFLNRREQRSQRGRIPGERPPASLAGLTKLIAKTRKCEIAKRWRVGGARRIFPFVFSPFRDKNRARLGGSGTTLPTSVLPPPRLGGYPLGGPAKESASRRRNCRNGTVVGPLRHRHGESARRRQMCGLAPAASSAAGGSSSTTHRPP